MHGLELAITEPACYPYATLRKDEKPSDAMPKLTAAGIERLQSDPTKRREVPDSVLPGLYLIVQPSGAKSWAVRYRHQGRPRKHTLGPLATLPLAEARARGRAALQAVAAGRDPAGEDKLARGGPQDLFQSVVADFIVRHVRVNNKRRTSEEVERLFKLHVMPAWSERDIKAITRRDVVDLLDAVVDLGRPIAANRTFAAVRKFFNWCVERGIVDASPCDRVRQPTVEKSRDRVLNDVELTLVSRAAERIGWPFGTLILVLLLTGQRRDEVAGLRRSEITGNLWTIPGRRTKNGLPNEVPLSAPVLELLKRAPRLSGDELVFSTTGHTAISGFSRAKTQLDRAILQIENEIAGEGGREPLKHTQVMSWRLHDLRRTLASGLARLGEPIHVIEAILNHRTGAISGVAAVYNRHSYRDEKRTALEKWASHFNRLTCGAINGQ